MTTYGWTNEAGEPIMDGAAYRFEQQLDMDVRSDYYTDHFYDDHDDFAAPCELDADDCTGDDLNKVDDHTGECRYCATEWPHNWNG